MIQSFCQVDGVLRVVITTVAFGLGLDCPNVRRIIHWSPSQDMEQYVQETGRAGRDGLPSVAALYVADVLGNLTEETMKDYCKNKTKCRISLLLEQFEDSGEFVAEGNTAYTDCQCCDVCEMVCMCRACSSQAL